VGAAVSNLPKFGIAENVGLADALRRRRSCRSFRPEPLTAEQVLAILWAGQGVTQTARGFRTAPSAGATFPLVLYAVLPDGVYRYDPDSNNLVQVIAGDLRKELAKASLEQYFVTQAGLIVVIAGNFYRTTSRYGLRGEHYVWMEIGHAAQNMFLAATAMGLGSVAIGAFDDEDVGKLVLMRPDERPGLMVVAGVKGEAS
jgi:SagB-type dehydrogenase family enzyme